MGITLQDAYTEACAALGEQIVERRLMARAEAQKSAEAEVDAADQPGETDTPKPQDRRKNH